MIEVEQMLNEDQKIKKILEWLSEESLVRRMSDKDIEKILTITLDEDDLRNLKRESMINEVCDMFDRMLEKKQTEGKFYYYKRTAQEMMEKSTEDDISDEGLEMIKLLIKENGGGDFDYGDRIWKVSQHEEKEGTIRFTVKKC